MKVANEWDLRFLRNLNHPTPINVVTNLLKLHAVLVLFEFFVVPALHQVNHDFLVARQLELLLASWGEIQDSVPTGQSLYCVLMHKIDTVETGFTY